MPKFEKLKSSVVEFNKHNKIVLRNGNELETIFYDASIEIEDIHLAEQKLGFDLCEDYRAFLLAFGHISCATETILGMSREKSGELKMYFVDTTKETIKNHGLTPPTHNCTVLTLSSDESWILFVNHENSQLFAYDAYSESFEKVDYTIEDVISDTLKSEME